ncbi:P27 family predicted phage terminase small subunit [Desulfosalsimonas propionicica]|uniref:P27 family predicted phage terminase small subunit n=1 Tax=Desulfosalsimonas propionicica TaxID=332175 RepID=A0A7W0CC94_9BACT|nr:P27 family phage terminase small subunit [Desulfosalsimonas propionicica]MBA2883066.1 P27 family predicted phage terminase small subunit [Desulfosalsimonas propionicica]
MTTPKTPKTLSREAAGWWRKLQAEYDIADEAGRLLLQTALESFDRMRECQGAIKKDGQVVKDRFGQDKPHPLLSAERDARAQLMQALKALNLDLEVTPHPGPGRPPGR